MNRHVLHIRQRPEPERCRKRWRTFRRIDGKVKNHALCHNNQKLLNAEITCKSVTKATIFLLLRRHHKSELGHIGLGCRTATSMCAAEICQLVTIRAREIGHSSKSAFMLCHCSANHQNRSGNRLYAPRCSAMKQQTPTLVGVCYCWRAHDRAALFCSSTDQIRRTSHPQQ